MAKVGIISHYYKSENYGGNLQAYALCKVINNLGYEAEQICLDRSTSHKFLRMAKKFIKNPLHFVKSLHTRNNAPIQHHNFPLLEFNSIMIPHSNIVYSEKNIHKCSDDYDIFIVGSDQVWHPLAVCDAYLLKFVPKHKVKISYAASLACGVDSLTSKNKRRYKKAFKSFAAISVREKEGVEILKDIYSGDIHWSLDPTLLLEREEWLELSTPSNINSDYIFCFLFGVDDRFHKVINEYAQTHKLKIVSVCTNAPPNRADTSLGNIVLRDIPASRLLSLINDAKYVFTDSFHITVFSILFQKNFTVFSRGGMESRIHSLLSIFDLQSRFSDTDDKISLPYVCGLGEIEYANKLKKFQQMKKNSIVYLRNNLYKYR